MKGLREKQKKEFSSLPKSIKTNQGITEKKAKLQKSLIFYKRKHCNCAQDSHKYQKISGYLPQCSAYET